MRLTIAFVFIAAPMVTFYFYIITRMVYMMSKPDCVRAVKLCGAITVVCAALTAGLELSFATDLSRLVNGIFKLSGP